MSTPYKTSDPAEVERLIDEGWWLLMDQCDHSLADEECPFEECLSTVWFLERFEPAPPQPEAS